MQLSLTTRKPLSYTVHQPALVVCSSFSWLRFYDIRHTHTQVCQCFTHSITSRFKPIWKCQSPSLYTWKFWSRKLGITGPCLILQETPKWILNLSHSICKTMFGLCFPTYTLLHFTLSTNIKCWAGQHCTRWWKYKISLLSRLMGQSSLRGGGASKHKQIQLRTQDTNMLGRSAGVGAG